MEDIEQHFHRLDSTKRLLFNAVTEQQEKSARMLLSVIEDEGKIIYIN